MRILFGSIITNGRGKIGGQFVKRIVGGHSLSNLPSHKSKKYLQLNSTLQPLAFIFARWNKLAESERLAWLSFSSTIPVLDAFGTSKFLTPRQFFTKVNAQNWFNNPAIILASEFTTVIGVCNVSLVSANFEDETVIFNFDLISDVAKFYVRIYKVSSSAVTPRFRNCKVLDVVNISDDADVNYFDLLLNNFFGVNTGQSFVFSFQPINEVGWNSTPQSFTVTLT